MTRRKQMTTFDTKLFEILSDLTETVMKGNILAEPDKRKELRWYIDYTNNILDTYWRDPHYEKLVMALSKISCGKIAECIRLHLKDHDVIGGLKFLAEACGCSEETIEDFGLLYQSSLISIEEDTSEETITISKKEFEKLMERINSLTRRIAILENSTSKNTFTKENITVDSIKTAEVRIRRGEYTETYENLDILLEEESLALNKPLEQIVNILAKQTGDSFRYFQINGKTRVEFLFK